MKIAPSILSMDFLRMADGISELQQEGVDVLHLDVMDGHFVPNLTFGPPVIKCIRPLFKGLMEAHLMVSSPERLLHEYVAAGCGRIIVHPESTVHLHRLCQSIRAEGAQVGVVLNPATPISVIEHVLDEVQLILLMTVNPGFGGQSYIKAMDLKIQQAVDLKKRYPKLEIEVDGGINTPNIRDMLDMGVDLAVVGSGIFNKKDTISVNYRKLMECLV